jgi:hypothetical protein
MLALADQTGVSFSISAEGTLKAKGGKEPVARLAPLIKEHKDALLAHLKAMEQQGAAKMGAEQERKDDLFKAGLNLVAGGLQEVVDNEFHQIAISTHRQGD